MRAEFEGLVSVVTGGGSGLGAATVQKLHDAGSKVAALDLNPPHDVEGILAVGADVASDASICTAIEAVVEHFGRLDILVNNAGIGAQGTIVDNGDDEWMRVLDINLLGVVRTSRAALPHLRLSPAPAIVNVGSIAATAGLPQRALYSATKGAVHALTRAMAADHLREGIRVNCLAPGTADTPWIERLLSKAADPTAERAALNARQPHGRMVHPDEVADGILYLASPSSGSTTGVSLAVDGGMQNLRLRPTDS